MIRRILVIAVIAAALVCAGAVVAWQMQIAAMASVVSAQADAARALVSAGNPEPRALAQGLLRPLAHVIIEDRANGVVYDAVRGNVDVRPLPPGPLPEGPPQGPPGQPGVPPRGRSPLAQLAGQLAHIPPQRIDSAALVIHITPDGEAQAGFLGIDTLIAALLLLAIVAGASYTIVTISRTERAKLEAVAEERRAAAAEFQRFLADAGHELRTPLTIVSGYVDILSSRADENDPTLKRLFEGMRAETARMRALVEKMLLLAKLETPVAVPSLVDVASVAKDAAESMRAKYDGREIKVTDGDRASIVIDQDDLYEALHNLIENALKYAPGSDVAVQTGIVDGRAYARVVDHGPGIPASERDAVFRRFYRGNERSDSEGSGLGLAIVARVADRWNGTIDLNSSPRETAFTLTFPLADEELHAVAR